MLQRHAPLVVGLVLALSVTLVGHWLVALGEEGRRARIQGSAAAQTSAVHSALDEELTATVHLARGMRGFLTALPETADPDHPLAPRLRAAMIDLHQDGEHLRNIGVAPGNVLRYVHPLEGNEAALGLRYEDHPAQWSQVQEAIVTRSTVLAGPVDLVQGGRGLISRTPVFLSDGSYWGMVSLVIDADSLLGRVADSVDDQGLVWGVVSDREDAPVLITGDPAVLEHGTEATRIPSQAAGASWVVVGAPTADLLAGGPAAVQRVALVVLALLLGWLVGHVLQQRRRAHELSIRDELTGLPNRRLLEDRMGQLVASSLRTGATWTLLLLDLDGFKPVNDELGHAMGDTVLCTIADRLQQATRPADTVARIGGDEFVVLLPGASDAAAVDLVLERLRSEVRRPVTSGSNVAMVDCSIGVSTFPADGAMADELLAAADASMYEVKALHHADVAQR